jgi:DNA replication protein DnaC
MRTEERWNEVIEQRFMKALFPARIVNVLQSLNLGVIYDKDSQFIYSQDKATGKTIRACRILLGWEKQNYLHGSVYSTAFLPILDLMNDLKHSFDSAGESEIDILRKYQAIDILVLDDLGANKMSDWQYQILYSLINYRYDNLKTTIITCNLSLTELETTWQDDRITSRIQRMCKIKLKEKYEE